VTVNLERFTVFVGANGSGKTSVLQALDLLCRAFRAEQLGQPGFQRQPDELDLEYRSNRSYGTAEEVELSCVSGDIRYRYRTGAQPQQHGQKWAGEGAAFATQLAAMVSTPEIIQKWAGEGAAFATEGNSPVWKQWQPQHGMLPNPVWLRLEAPLLRQHQGPPHGFSHGPDPRLMDVNGSGMHTALASMALEDPDEWRKLQDDLRRIVPSVLRLRHTPQSELLFDTINGKGLKAIQVSEGTLLTLGLLAAIHGVNEPGVLLLDDLDRALHPKAQRELIDLLRGVQATNPDIQIVGSTHSPYLLDGMKPNEVLVTSLREDGSTACEPLTRHPKFEKWKEEFHPGEMWSFFGEQWVAGAEVATK